MLPTLLAALALIQPAEPPPETLIKLTVDPMAAPKPALKYLLLPELREMAPGNPIPNYMKAVLDKEAGGTNAVLSKQALQQVDRAARMDKPDWQILEKLRTDGFNLLLPDVQKMRELAAGLQNRFRDEVAQRRFDDALVTAKTMFALSRHMGEHPTLIGDLVAIAIAMVAIQPLEEMLGTPDCPNLYWALTHLPAPFIALDRGMEGERTFVGAVFRDLDDQKPMTTAQLKTFVKMVNGLLDGPNSKLGQEWLSGRAQDDAYMAAARKRLTARGIPADRIDTFSNYQIILLNEKIEYEVVRDEVMKFAVLPTWEALPRMDAADKNVKTALFGGLAPALHKVRRAQGRLEQRVALLRHVEAIRMYAAAHDGKVPAKLSEVDVPLPVDPFTGKPFRYEVIDGVAHIRGTPPKGDEQNVAYNLHYEIVIRK